MNTIIEYPIDDLTKEIFTFNFFERSNTLVLDSYILMRRKTKRHGFKTDLIYERLPFNNRHFMNVINVHDVPLTDAVKDNAKQLFMADIKVDIDF